MGTLWGLNRYSVKQPKKNIPARQEHRIRFSDDLIWGIHPVLQALQSESSRITEVVLQKNKRGSTWDKIIDCARRASIKCLFVESIKMSGNDGVQIKHQGVVARGTAVGLISLDEMLAKFSGRIHQGQKPRIIVCDSLQDPHNLGALIRTAHAAGVEFVLITRERSAPLGGTAAKAAAGALSLVDICQVTNLTHALQACKDAGAWVFGAVKERDAQSIYETDFNLPACIVIGNEGSGIRQLVRRTCDVLISIPMAGELDSLNSSVAGAIIMFEMHRQKLSSQHHE